MVKANRKLLMSALTYEATRDTNMDKFCDKLYEMGIIEENYASESNTLCFVESEPTDKQIIEVLNHIGYDLK